MLPFIRIAVDAAMVVLILLVQLIIYPSFRSIAESAFTSWHRRYVTVIGYIVIPLMLVQAGCIGMQLFAAVDGQNMLSAASVLMAWIVTFAVSAPCHRVLQMNGQDPETIDRLIKTNWLRTICWLIAWAAGVVSAIKGG